MVTIRAAQVNRDLRQAVGSLVQAHTQQLGRVQEAAVVVEGAEDVELLGFIVPVSAHAGKSSGAIVQCVGQDAHFGLGIGDYLASKVRVYGKFHRFRLQAFF